MADPWNEAWAEAEATAPPEELAFDTLELQHPSFLTDESPQEAFPIRVVNGVSTSKIFGVEAEALFNGGENVEFKPAMFYADVPEFREGQVPECPITIDNVAEDVQQALMNASEYQADLIVIFRKYLETDPSEPAYGPVEFKVRNISIAGTAVRGTASLEDLRNRKFPKMTYNINEYPNLLP